MTYEDQILSRYGLGPGTKVQTREHGLQPIRSMVGQTVNIFDSTSWWTKADIVTRGLQMVRKVKLTRRGATVYISATNAYPWLIEGNEHLVRTDDLKVDGTDVLVKARGDSWSVSDVSFEFPEMVYGVQVGAECSFYGALGVLLYAYN